MNAQTDQQLLEAYAGNHSEPAFAELVRRHIDLVYSAAQRMVCDAHLAEDVTQSVFVALARNARQLTQHPVLSGWLHRTTQNLAANAVRTNIRRQTREQEAVVMNELLAAEPEANWEHIAPHLDAALGDLSEPDRDALLLRFFERKSAREMAQTLGISDEAAQKRVTRAVDRMREFFAKRGVTVGTSGLAVVITANAVQAAPVGLALTISTAATLAGTALTATITTQTTLTTMNWLNLKSITAIIAAALAAGTGTYLVQQRSAEQLRAENQKLVAAEQTLTVARDEALAAANGNADELKRRQSEKDELLRLRGEVGRLRKVAKEAEQLAEQNRGLQGALAQATQAAPKTEPDPEANPERRFAIERMNQSKQLVLGLIMYANDNQDIFPAEFKSISPYFNGAYESLSESFDFVLPGVALTSVTNPSVTIAIRGKTPFPMNGKQAKVYAFADGHSEIKREPEEGFEAWEKARIPAPPKQ